MQAQEVVKDLPDSCAGKTLDMTTASRRARRNKKKRERRGQVVTPPADEDIRLFHCRFQDLEKVAGLKPGSANLFLPDIPYEKAFLPEVDDLGQLARRTLVEGGLLVLYTGQAYLNRVMAALDNYLTYCWTAAFTWGGDGNVFHRFIARSRQGDLSLLWAAGKTSREISTRNSHVGATRWAIRVTPTETPREEADRQAAGRDRPAAPGPAAQAVLAAAGSARRHPGRG